MRLSARANKVAILTVKIADPADVALARQRVEAGHAELADVIIASVQVTLEGMNPRYAKVWQHVHGFGVQQLNRNTIAKAMGVSHVAIAHAYYRAHAIVMESIADSLLTLRSEDNDTIDAADAQAAQWREEGRRHEYRSGSVKAATFPGEKGLPKSDAGAEAWERYHRERASRGDYDPTSLTRSAWNGMQVGTRHARRT